MRGLVVGENIQFAFFWIVVQMNHPVIVFLNLRNETNKGGDCQVTPLVWINKIIYQFGGQTVHDQNALSPNQTCRAILFEEP